MKTQLDTKTLKCVRAHVKKTQREAFSSNAGQASRDLIDEELQCLWEWLDEKIKESLK